MKYILEGSDKRGNEYEQIITVSMGENFEEINLIFEETGNVIALSEFLQLIEHIKSFYEEGKIK